MFAKDTARLWVPDMDRIPYTSRSDLLVLKQVLHVYVLDWSRLYYVVYILALDQHLGHRC